MTDSRDRDLFIIFLLGIIATVLIANYFSDITVSSKLFSAGLSGGLNSVPDENISDPSLTLIPTLTPTQAPQSDIIDTELESAAASLEICSCGLEAPSGPLCSHAYAVLPWPAVQTCWLLKVDFIPTTGTCNSLNGTNFPLGPLGFERGNFTPTRGTFSACASEASI